MKNAMEMATAVVLIPFMLAGFVYRLVARGFIAGAELANDWIDSP